MKTYYRLFESYFLDYGVVDGPKLPDESVMAGKWVEAEALPQLVYDINVPDDEPCQHFMTSGTVLASEHLITVLQNAGVTNFQRFQVLLINPETKKQREGFFLFNVLGLVKSTDLQKHSLDSLVTGDAEGMGVPSAAFDRTGADDPNLGGLHMFRMAESPSVLVVDEAVKAALENNRPEGGWGIMLEEIE